MCAINININTIIIIDINSTHFDLFMLFSHTFLLITHFSALQYRNGLLSRLIAHYLSGNIAISWHKSKEFATRQVIKMTIIV